TSDTLARLGLQRTETCRTDLPRRCPRLSGEYGPSLHLRASFPLCIPHHLSFSPLFLFQVIGFIYGLIIEQFGWTVYIMIAGFAISCLLTLPPWPMYRRHPLTWQPALPETPAENREKPQENLKKKKHK
uniref:Signal peptidase complex subunit 1 n=1 Tax=Electrophorus electricus TaxID=8005 RepID=A0A4W4EFU2_ELEEL